METMYVIQDETGYTVGAAYEEVKAAEICKENKGYTYRLVPHYMCEGTRITALAGPIPPEYLKGS